MTLFLKILIVILDVFWAMWTLWGLAIHFNWVEGEQHWSTPFPAIRIITMCVLLVLTVLVFKFL